MLQSHPCQAECAWSPAHRVSDGPPLFRCAGCDSEWTRSELWTPAERDGTVAPEIAAEAARR